MAVDDAHQPPRTDLLRTDLLSGGGALETATSAEMPDRFSLRDRLLYLAGLIFFPVVGDYIAAVAWLVALPAALWAYVRLFPHICEYLGYGRVDDVAPASVERRPVRVTVYTSLGCPFCPIVESRLKALQQDMGFELEQVDVTLRPYTVTAKNIRSVPVVEVGNRRLVGHATTRELAALIRDAAWGV